MKKRVFISKSDIIIIVAVLVCAALLLIPSALKKDRLTAEICINGRVEHTIELNEVEKEYDIPIGGRIPVTVTAGRGYICFKESECPDKLCVKSGRLYRNGQTAACLPARVVISVKGSGKAPDAITY